MKAYYLNNVQLLEMMNSRNSYYETFTEIFTELHIEVCINIYLQIHYHIFL